MHVRVKRYEGEKKNSLVRLVMVMVMVVVVRGIRVVLGGVRPYFGSGVGRGRGTVQVM